MLPTEGITTIEKALLFANMEKNGYDCKGKLKFDREDFGKLSIDPYAKQFTSEVYRIAPESEYSFGIDYWQIAREDENYTDVMDILSKLHTDGLINEIHEIE